MTREEYLNYEAAFRMFMESEGLERFDTKPSDDEAELEPYFSWTPCECCGRPEGGDRQDCIGHSVFTDSILEFAICPDCIYYMEYSKLDDTTMESINES